MGRKILYIYKSASSTELEVLERIKDQAKYLNIDVVEIDSVGNIPSKCRVLIVDPFDLELVKSIWTKDINIYAAKYILFCFTNELPFPRPVVPLRSMILKDKIVTLSDLVPEEKANISFMVQSMSGEISLDFTTAVTHLIVGKVGTRKYHYAVKGGIPILTSQWVYDLWKLSLQYVEKETEADQIHPYECPCFYGLVICVTGFSNKERQTIKSLITSHGGTYSPNLVLHESTHLIIGENRVEKKYQAARSWRIPCVLLSWIEACVQRNYCIETKEYLFIEEFNESPSIVNQTTLLDDKISICNYFNKSLPKSFLEKDFTSISETDNLNKLTKLDLPFKDLTFFISSKLESNIIMQLAVAIQKLGGSLIYDPSVEYIYYVTDNFDIPTVTESHPISISSKWIFECLKQNMKVPENEYLIKEVDKSSTNLVVEDFSEKVKKSIKLNSLNKHIQELMTLKKDSNEISTNMTDKYHIEDKLENLYSKKFNDEPPLIKNISQFNPSGGNLVSSQAEIITYDDPDAKTARERLIGYFKFPSEEDRLHYKENQSLGSKEIPQSPISPYINNKKGACKFMQNTSISEFVPNDMYFLLSSLEPDEKQLYSSIITKLRGNLIDSGSYEPHCTHTVVGKISRTQKFLCSIAAGKWILKPSFLDESNLLGCFANETNHEWGIEPNPSISAQACHKWRVHKQETKFGAFREFKVLLHVDRERIDGVFKVLNAGDATIIEYTDELKLDSSITHVIIDRNCELSDSEIGSFKKITPNIYQPEYVLEYLLSTNDSSLQKFIYLPGRKRKRFNKIANSNHAANVK